MKDIIKRLRLLVAETSGGNAREFARKCDIPYGTLQGYFHKRLPHAEHLIRMADSVGVNINWLLTGRGEMFDVESAGSSALSQSEFELDMEVLHRILKWVDEWLDSQNKTLSSDKKARFVALAYKYFTTPREDGEGRDMDDKDMNDWLRLVV